MAVNPAHASAAPQIIGAIRQAAQSIGINFEYLLTTTKIESQPIGASVDLVSERPLSVY